ncbi:MAG: COX15/CtaA family protein [Lautropia sp.]|nr:COX15/CtaA family protein [Lautropia sp.]
MPSGLASGAEVRLSSLRRRYRRLLWITLFVTFDLIIFGAFVRLADAGLGCPDWPGCYGHFSPLGAMDQIRAEVAVLPDGPVTVFKAWVEMLHRYVASGLGLMVIVLLWLCWRWRRGAALAGLPERYADGGFAPSLRLAVFSLVWIILQGLFGMWTVTLRLQPVVVTAHLMGAMILFMALMAQWNRVAAQPVVDGAARAFRHAARLVLVLILVQVALGGWVSSNYAALACQDFPRCQGSFWPSMDLTRGFELWRPLGMQANGMLLPFEALVAIHYVHRLMAYGVFLVAGWLAWKTRHVPGIRHLARWLGAVLLAQLTTGLANVFLGWPLLAALLHTAGAAALVAIAFMLDFRVRHAGFQMLNETCHHSGACRARAVALPQG